MAAPAKASRTLDDLFGIDVRGLAAFRIALGLLIAAQAVLQLRQLSLPAEPSLAGWADLDWLVLLGCGAFIAAGRGVCWACVLAWPALFRHVMVHWHTGGVEIHRYLLLIGVFWLLLVPADLVGRIGGPSHHKQHPPRRILSWATTALLVQVFFLYYSAGTTKSHAEWIIQADALENLMHTPFATPLGRSLVAAPWLLKALSIATILLEVGGPIACFVPGRQLTTVRNIVLFALATFHLGLLLTMNLETIPLVVQAFWLLLVPSATWDRLWPRADLAVETAGEPSAFLQCVAKLMLAGMTASFVLSIALTRDPTGTLIQIHRATPKIGLYQEWRMFGSPATLRAIAAEQAAETEP
jgi:HTTM domain